MIIAYEKKTVDELRAELQNLLNDVEALVDARLTWNGGSAEKLNRALTNAINLLDDDVEVPDEAR